MALIDKNGLSTSPFVFTESDTPSAHSFVALEHWKALGKPQDVGVRVDFGTSIDDLVELGVHKLPLIALHFPKFADGRNYSSARLLKERHHFEGELRAEGDILRDQLFYLSRCGFDTFELKAGQNAEAALKAFREFSDVYQTAADGLTPVYRRNQ